ncbi:MAG: hypothetical protein E6K77_02070 [Candidatus Eisenbacteria bacterium]|uniref:Uncharacterized protein n=1 Tax=Eiseniibacteriota bacterium TaxID=2212470 RepID=A0A538TQ79_UNCEI|nr:MAG: hypothetical protein E6K77_02070 [Candidatus Eisenbacteria bacterium]
MKKGIVGFVMAAAVVLAISAQAGQPSKHPATTVTGEVVDTGCYLGHASKGASHASCATMCIDQGMPMGVLTQKGVLYLVTMNHDNPDAYNKLGNRSRHAGAWGASWPHAPGGMTMGMGVRL